MSEEKQKEIKTLKGWEESGKNWDDFCKPGDLVDEDVYWYFLNILPPRNMGAGYLQVGEPYDSRLNPKTGKYVATYSTFVKVGDKVWRYCGNCFPGEYVDTEYKPTYNSIKEFLRDTYGIKDGMQQRRLELDAEMGLKCQCKPELCCIAYRDSIFRTESIQLAKSDFRTERKN